MKKHDQARIVRAYFTCHSVLQLEKYWMSPHGLHPTALNPGGEKPKSEKARLRKGLVLLCATPGRLSYHLEHTATFIAAWPLTDLDGLGCLVFSMCFFVHFP